MMKKHLCGILILLLLLSLTACGGGSGSEGGDSPSEEIKDTEESTVPMEPNPEWEKCSVPTKRKNGYLTYKVIDGVELQLYFCPPSKDVYEKAPIIVNYPGGGFTQSKIMDYHRFLMNEYAAINGAGFATATVQYRTTTDHRANMEQIMSDCMDALRYLSRYSEELGVDPQNIITFGHSAGATTALLMGYAPHDVFDADAYYSMYDFHVSGVFAMSPRPDYTRLTDNISFPQILFPDSSMRERCSAINYVSNGGVPCKVLMGEEDPIIPVEVVKAFKDACDQGGVPCELVLFKNADHGYDSVNGQPVTPDYDAERATIVSFAQQCVAAHLNADKG